MTVPLLDKKIIKKRVKKFKRPQSDRIFSVKTNFRRPKGFRLPGQKKVQGFHFDGQHWIWIGQED